LNYILSFFSLSLLSPVTHWFCLFYIQLGTSSDYFINFISSYALVLFILFVLSSTGSIYFICFIPSYLLVPFI